MAAVLLESVAFEIQPETIVLAAGSTVRDDALIGQLQERGVELVRFNEAPNP